MSTNIAEKPAGENSRTWWLIAKPFDVVSTVLYLGVLAAFLRNVLRADTASSAAMLPDVVAAICAIALLLAIDRLEYRFYGEETPRRLAIILLIVRIILIEVVAEIDHMDLSPFLYLLIPYIGCLYFGRAVGYGLTALIVLWYMVWHQLHDFNWLQDQTELHYLGLFTLGVIFSVTIAQVVRKEKSNRARTEQLLAELEVSHQQLKVYAEQVAELATTKERNRLARDIHDTLGHYLTVINVQLEKALAFREKKPQESEQAVKDAKRLASEALHDVRRSVSALRTTQEVFVLVPALTELATHLQSEQCAVELTIEGSEERFDKAGLMVLYRVAQEGLTNVRKHARASVVRLAVCFGEQEARLALSDNGQGFDTTTTTGQGYGLLGIQERLELVGGSLRIESEPGKGTRLFAVVPEVS